MFYSHQLLARKAPLGQIWMAATMHAKINRKKLGKLNIIKICEEILNPSVPMALRLSGILMGGVVIVYERKVKLLYDDVTRFLVEINEAWKVKAAPDPTLLPKGKSQARYEAVTLPDNQETELGEIEQSVTNTNTMMEFQQTGYFAMRLDSVDELYINKNPREEDQSEWHHQADADNITLSERFDSHQMDLNPFNRYERFDIEGDDETQLNFASQEHTCIPSILIPSPPHQLEPEIPDEIPDQRPEYQANQPSEVKEARQDQRRVGPIRRKPRKTTAFAMDYEQTIIPGQIYQSWLQNASDIVSRGGRKRKRLDPLFTMKIANFMELPPTAQVCGLFETGNQKIHYPKQLLELWMRSTQPPHDSPSGKTSPPQPPQPSSSSPPNNIHDNGPSGFPFEDFQNELSSGSLGASIEHPVSTFKINEIPTKILMEGLTESSMLVTPRNFVEQVKSFPSSGSGHGFAHNLEVNSGRSNRKRPYSSSRHSGSSLEPVAEENLLQHPDPNFKLARLSEDGLTPENDLFVETGPTQTQHLATDPPVDHITDSIRVQLKMHFDTPGSAQTESLNLLASGMNKRRAAHLFYQTCVLATRDFLKVEQKMPYGDILISRGAKM